MATPPKKPGEGSFNRGGRPTKRTAALIEAICANLEVLAMPIELAAEAEGVHRTTVQRWMALYPDVLHRITRARAVGAKTLSVRQSAGGKGSSEAAWMLVARYREFYGPPRAEEKAPEGIKIIIEGGLPKRPT